MFTAITFSAQAVGQATSFAPDYGKAKIAAAKCFALIDNKPEIDIDDEGGKKPVSRSQYTHHKKFLSVQIDFFLEK